VALCSVTPHAWPAGVPDADPAGGNPAPRRDLACALSRTTVTVADGHAHES